MSRSCEGFQPGIPLGNQPQPSLLSPPRSAAPLAPWLSLQTGQAGGDASPRPLALSLPGPQPRQFVAMLVAGPPRHGARAPPGPWDTASPPQGPGTAPLLQPALPACTRNVLPAPSLGCGEQPVPSDMGCSLFPLDVGSSLFPRMWGAARSPRMWGAVPLPCWVLLTRTRSQGRATAPPLRGPGRRLWCCSFLFSLAFSLFSLTFILPPAPPPHSHILSPLLQ